jgi:alpha-tubulin suppressor-like RCC1 family protein
MEALPSRSVILVVGLVSIMGCRDEAGSPTGPTPTTLQADMAATLAFRQVSAGEYHTCGVTTDNRAYCWGANGGTLGDGTTIDRLQPAAVLGEFRFRHVSAGGSQHTCGVTTDYQAYCWGLNHMGQLGDGTTTLRSMPAPVAGGRQFRQVSAGTDYACGITYPDDRAFCWGRNDYGQLGVGDQIQRLTPAAVQGGRRFRQISASQWFAGHTCALTTTNEVYCWGSNRYGQIGDSSTAKRRVRPVLVVGGREFAHVDAGPRQTCGVTTASRAFCWGYGVDGQLGTGDTHSSSWPRPVARRLTFVRVTGGVSHTCGETTTGQAYCWGTGPLGTGSGTTELKPIPVTGGLLFGQLSTGPYHTCGKTTTSTAYCWGYNGWGQLGDGTTTSRLVPTAVADPLSPS